VYEYSEQDKHTQRNTPEQITTKHQGTVTKNVQYVWLPGHKHLMQLTYST